MKFKRQWSADDANLGKYFLSIQSPKFKALTSQEELELYKRIRAGDKTAEHTLAKANLLFVVSVARNYQNQGISLEDLVGIGNLGLLRAVKKFDARKNFRFISYAVWWVRQAILQAISEQSRTTSVPLNQTTRIRHVRIAVDKLTQKLRRRPTIAEIAEDTKLRVSEVEEAVKMDYAPLSMDKPVRAESNVPLVELMGDGSSPGDTASQAYGFEKVISKAFKILSEREKIVLTMYFGLNGHVSTLEEIGQRLRLTRERVRQIKDRAVKSLQGNRLLRDLLR